MFSTYCVCRAFVSRSFGSFMQTDGNQRRLVEAEELEARASQFMQQFKDTATTTVKDINVGDGCGSRMSIWLMGLGVPSRYKQGVVPVHTDLID